MKSKLQQINHKLTFRTLEKSDWEQVAKIYQEGLDTGHATFETQVPTWEAWDKGHLKECRIVAEVEVGIVAGWVALTPVSSRCVYGGVAEVSVYISSKYRGQKIGTSLLEKLIAASENVGIWTLQSSLFPENIGSLKIHEKLNFRKMGYREKIGKMNGVWRDTIILERRSESVGVD